jgi:serpin B
MRSIRTCIFFPVLVVIAILNTGALAGGTKSLVMGNTSFAFDLYARLKETKGNLFFSPYSISTSLAIVYAGANGDTETQMNQVLHFGNNQAHLPPAFRDLQGQLNGTTNGIELSIVNACWAQKGDTLLPDFLSIVRNDYHGSVHLANFKTDADSAVRSINNWVARETHDRISNILSPGSVDDKTALILANAIYFKGSWATQFSTYNTSTQPFHLSATNEVSAPLMFKADYVKIAETDEYQAVELPYRGKGASMVVLLPRQLDGLERLEQRLSPAFIESVLAQMTDEIRSIFLPKFTINVPSKLDDTLAKMGMTDAFSQAAADFSGVNGNWRVVRSPSESKSERVIFPIPSGPV